MYQKAFLVDNIPTITNVEALNVPSALLIDVRNPDEYVGELGHIKDAQLVTLGPDLEKFLANTKKDQTIIFICRSGARSARATQYAQSLGIKDVYNMQGGMLAWKEKGLEVE